MTGLRSYFLSVAATAILVSLIAALTPEGKAKKTLTFTGSMVMILVVLSPLLRIDENALKQAARDLQEQSQSWNRKVSFQNEQLLSARIKQSSEAYILDKTAALGVEMDLSITVGGDETIPKPISAKITGTFSRAARETIAALLEEDLGIPRDKQEWNTS